MPITPHSEDAVCDPEGICPLVPGTGSMWLVGEKQGLKKCTTRSQNVPRAANASSLQLCTIISLFLLVKSKQKFSPSAICSKYAIVIIINVFYLFFFVCDENCIKFIKMLVCVE